MPEGVIYFLSCGPTTITSAWTDFKEVSSRSVTAVVPG